MLWEVGLWVPMCAERSRRWSAVVLDLRLTISKLGVERGFNIEAPRQFDRSMLWPSSADRVARFRGFSTQS
jgi:hypothetical protein